MSWVAGMCKDQRDSPGCGLAMKKYGTEAIVERMIVKQSSQTCRLRVRGWLMVLLRADVSIILFSQRRRRAASPEKQQYNSGYTYNAERNDGHTFGVAANWRIEKVYADFMCACFKIDLNVAEFLAGDDCCGLAVHGRRPAGKVEGANP